MVRTCLPQRTRLMVRTSCLPQGMRIRRKAWEYGGWGPPRVGNRLAPGSPSMPTFVHNGPMTLALLA